MSSPHDAGVSASRGDQVTAIIVPVVETLCGRAVERLRGSGLTSISVAICADAHLVALVYASDARALALYGLESGLGEGPSSAAFGETRPLLIADLGSHSVAAFPVFATQSPTADVRSICAIPLISGRIAVGVLTVSGAEPAELSDAVVSELLSLADAVLVALLTDTASSGERPGARAIDGAANVTHQAAGMIMVRLVSCA